MRATLTSVILPVLSVALIVTGRPVHAADVDTLKGLRSLIVLIEDVAPEAKDDGLTVEDLRSEVEGQLRDAGLQIRGDATESLYININAHRIGTRDGRYMYNIEVRVSQPVRVLRTNEVAMSPTWQLCVLRALRSLRALRCAWSQALTPVYPNSAGRGIKVAAPDSGESVASP